MSLDLLMSYISSVVFSLELMLSRGEKVIGWY